MTFSIDTATYCRDLRELIAGHKGVPQDKSQRLVIMALRERRLKMKTRATLKLTDRDMPANPLTKQIVKQHVFDELIRSGTLEFQDMIEYRKSRRVEDFTEKELEGFWSNTQGFASTSS